MDNIKRAMAQILIIVFAVVMIVPLLLQPFEVPSDTERSTDIVSEVGYTVWTFRLAEVYLHAIFLSVAIIGSILVIRKPPKLLPTIQFS